MWEEIALLSADALLTGGKARAASEKQSAEETLLQTREAQSQIQAEKKVEKDQAQLASILSSQKADEAASGFEGSSFGTISKSSFDAYLNDVDMISLNEKYQQNLMEQQISESKKSKNASIFGTLASFGKDAVLTHHFMGHKHG